MKYGSWFQGFTRESLTKLMLEHPDLANTLGVNVIKNDKYTQSIKKIEKDLEQKYPYDYCINNFKKKMLEEIAKVQNERIYKDIFMDPKVYAENEKSFSKLKNDINNEWYFFNDGTIWISKLKVDKEIITSKYNQIKKESEKDEIAFDKAKTEELYKIKQAIPVKDLVDINYEEKLKEPAVIELINKFAEEINLQDWRKFATLQQKELETLINLKVISKELLKIKDNFSSQDITKQLSLYTNLKDATSIIIGCDHRHVEVKNTENDMPPTLKIIHGGCAWHLKENEEVKPMYQHPNDSKNVYVTTLGTQYNIFMNLFHSEQLKILLDNLPNIKEVQDHTHEIFQVILDTEINSMYPVHHIYEGGATSWVRATEAVKLLLETIELLTSREIEIHYNDGNDHIWTKENTSQLQEKYENFILGEALPNYIEME